MSLEPLNTTSSETGRIWIHVNRETFTHQSRSYAGPSLIGQVHLREIENSPNGLTIDIMIDASCAKRLATELITEANLEPSPIKLRLKFPPSSNSNQCTSKPSQPTSDGTDGSETSYTRQEPSLVLPDGAVNFGVVEMMMQHYERRLRTIHRALLRTLSTPACCKYGELDHVSYLCKSMTLSLSSIQSILRTQSSQPSGSNWNIP